MPKPGCRQEVLERIREEGLVSAEELPPEPRLEGKRRCGFPEKQSKGSRQGERP